MTYEVQIMPSAKADVFEIRAWLSEYDVELADAWLWECSKAITSLREFPNRCKISDESDAFDVEVRELLFGKRKNVYRILFAVSGKRVNVLRIRSTKQQRLIDELDPK